MAFTDSYSANYSSLLNLIQKYNCIDNGCTGTDGARVFCNNAVQVRFVGFKYYHNFKQITLV